MPYCFFNLELLQTVCIIKVDRQIVEEETGMKKILFQGDSITDAGRSREIERNAGWGYATLVKAELGYEEPNAYEFYNRGIGGNRLVDVYARIKTDIIQLKPDIMSILIGINDVWSEIRWENGSSPEKYYKLYSMLIEEVKEALPDIKIMILEPFVLHGEATNEHWERFRSETEALAKKAAQIAEKYNLPFIPLQHLFDEAYKKAPEGYWLGDGVHPSAPGHEIIKREWIKAFREL